ncbi:MAG: SpoIID/LytB domain-containing protein [Cyanobacteria bacterium J06597_1]
MVRVFRWAIGVGAGVWLGSITVVGAVAANVANPTLEVGIVQRFGESSGDRLTVSAVGGAQVVLDYPAPTSDGVGESALLNRQLIHGPLHDESRFADSEGLSVTVPSITVGVSNQFHPQSIWQQRLILSRHRSFESAEASAREWETLGVQTLTVQPEEWQVWADPETYSSLDYERILEMARSRDRFSANLDNELVTFDSSLSWTLDGETITGDTLAIRSSTGGPLIVNGRVYGGDLVVQPNTFGTYTVVNNVPIETYLRGVVPHEIGPGAPYEAIRAQAILARTYALQNRHRFAPDNYELCADTQCQVYRGLSETISEADRAIVSTAGQVLTYDGQLVDAVYSSTSGGMTADFTHIWDGEPRPYLQSLPDTLLQNPPVGTLDLSRDDHFRQFLGWRSGFNEAGVSNYFRWRLDQPLGKLTDNLRENQKYLGIAIPPYEEIVGLEIIERSPSGRVQAMRLDLRQRDGNLTSVTLRKDEILLGLRATYSLLFAIDPMHTDGDLSGYRFIGGGLGHGVGMSQYGSYTLARRGLSAINILSFYYPGTAIAPLTPALADQTVDDVEVNSAAALLLTP